MGSSFSIVNDTQNPVGVAVGIYPDALSDSLAGTATVVTMGAASEASAAAAAGEAASAAATTAATAGVFVGVISKAATEAHIITSEGKVQDMTASTLTKISRLSQILDFTDQTLGELPSVERQRVQVMLNHVQKILRKYTILDPGDNYKYKGSLSLEMTVYVTKDDGSIHKHQCWTGPTKGSNHEYKISQYFA